MSNRGDDNVETITGCGFRIVKGAAGIEVVRDNTTFSSSTLKKRTAVFLCGVMASCLMFAVLFIRIGTSPQLTVAWAPPHFPSDQSIVISVLIAASRLSLPFWPLLIVSVALYSGTINLNCTRESVQTTWKRFGKVKRILFYPRAEVKRFQYSGAPNPLNGRSGYLGFVANGKVVKCLPGIKSVEAQLVLVALKQMGYDVACDPQLENEARVESSWRKKQ